MWKSWAHGGLLSYGVLKIGDQPEQNNVEESDASEDDGYYVFSASDGESNTLPLMIENEPVNVIIDSGATCNLMSEKLLMKCPKES